MLLFYKYLLELLSVCRSMMPDIPDLCRAARRRCIPPHKTLRGKVTQFFEMSCRSIPPDCKKEPASRPFYHCTRAPVFLRPPAPYCRDIPPQGRCPPTGRVSRWRSVIARKEQICDFHAGPVCGIVFSYSIFVSVNMHKNVETPMAEVAENIHALVFFAASQADRGVDV